ncbi:hypothetical protein FIBSPDRAFT_24083 [Athelia psychrophila]|uniref:Uncharacterized protein n=1 Tax=Athelia psychrophila TaxID=1759441 RepID=A0A166GDA9_9AGAM|nr:hypothetical protein FIBSPDRAFT_24083 [Fibularhizoctonia sp. CBS 109695]
MIMLWAATLLSSQNRTNYRLWPAPCQCLAGFTALILLVHCVARHPVASVFRRDSRPPLDAVLSRMTRFWRKMAGCHLCLVAAQNMYCTISTKCSVTGNRVVPGCCAPSLGTRSGLGIGHRSSTSSLLVPLSSQQPDELY